MIDNNFRQGYATSGRGDLTAEATKILSLGLKLGKEISDMIVDTVTRHATNIEDFVNRKEEILNVDARFLWFFAVALELDFASATWQEHKTNDVIKEIAQIAIRDIRFTSSSLKTESKWAIERDSLRANLSKMHENLHKSWGVLRKGGIPPDDIIFHFGLYYLRRVYPPISSLFGTGNVPLLASLNSQFGLKVIPPQFRRQSQHEGTAPPGSKID
jgi:hypothetical protein